MQKEIILLCVSFVPAWYVNYKNITIYVFLFLKLINMQCVIKRIVYIVHSINNIHLNLAFSFTSVRTMET